MTLDQYYYVSLDDTTKRDMDQVMARYIQRQEARRATGGRNLIDEVTKIPHAKMLSQILVVNQVWLWVRGNGMLLSLLI
jgi:hypothetical protein